MMCIAYHRLHTVDNMNMNIYVKLRVPHWTFMYKLQVKSK